MFFLQSLSVFSFVFEILALFLSFYLKNTKIFFLALALLSFRLIYLYSSIYQAHLFVSLFLPFVFLLFIITQNGILVFDKINLNKIFILLFTLFLSLFLSKSTVFNGSLGSFELGIFHPISTISFLCFLAEILFLLFLNLRTKEWYLLAAFIASYIQFLFIPSLQASYFEFSSLIFVFYLGFKTYKNAFYDSSVGLKNYKALKRFCLGKEGMFLGILHFENLPSSFLKKMAKFIQTSLKTKVFFHQNQFICILKNEKDSEKLEKIKNTLLNSSLSKSENFNIHISVAKYEKSLEESLKEN